ncbi:alpha/beta hydrolase-fold protein [Spirosoma sp. RP8]|uniref:Alpha/beta hydrolase-fold protein n=1 Tax=Spirosoma liriopis TaxID=2937440 RepID=A0ABT0HTA6_9BACT|nr:esterase [Spirosoma liriopis]MCK8495396.1 alpha/beta hydrolase-fold protein [Spirosoma liriopis]
MHYKHIISYVLNRFRLLLWGLVCLSGIVLAQPPRGPLVVSPQVNADKTVTFRYLAPAAKEVRLSAQFEKAPVPMTKGDQGIWSVTVGPVKPDIYPYSFQVDGVTVMDPANVAFFPNERFKASLVDVPGDTPLVHAMRNVPHGSVNYEYYPALEGTTGSLLVYTPPGYDQNPTKKYPVFYLISGTTDTEETFFKVGRTNLILDNLIAEGKTKPMIIIMPYGNIAARVVEQKGGTKPADPTVRDGADAVKRANDFATDLVSHVIPYVEKSYRTLNNRDNRAIGGFSRGGGQTLRTAFGNMDKFAWVCSYSSYLSPTEMDKSFPQIGSNADNTNKQLKLLWVSVGSDDFLYKGTVEFMDYLKARKVSYKSLITDGGHTWMNVKKYVAETTPLLFQ